MTRTGSRGGTLTSVRIGVLGPVDGPSGLSGLRLRGLLARLALDAGRPVSTAALVDGLWDTPPDNAANALQALVSRLRRSVAGELVVTEPGGYRLAVDPRAVDVMAFDARRGPARCAGAGRDDVVAEDGGAARVGAQQGGEDPDGGGLARPVGPQQAEDGARAGRRDRCRRGRWSRRSA